MAANQRHKSSGRKSQARPDRENESARSYARRFTSEMGEGLSKYMSQGSTQIRELTRDHEGTAVLVAMAAGFGVGLVIGAALASSQRPQTWRERIAAEGLGRRLLDRIEGVMPDALTDLIHR
jgi:hypothetical protein